MSKEIALWSRAEAADFGLADRGSADGGGAETERRVHSSTAFLGASPSTFCFMRFVLAIACERGPFICCSTAFWGAASPSPSCFRVRFVVALSCEREVDVGVHSSTAFWGASPSTFCFMRHRVGDLREVDMPSRWVEGVQPHARASPPWTAVECALGGAGGSIRPGWTPVL